MSNAETLENLRNYLRTFIKTELKYTDLHDNPVFNPCSYNVDRGRSRQTEKIIGEAIIEAMDDKFVIGIIAAIQFELAKKG